MEVDEYPVETILEAIDDLGVPPKQRLKVLLFDIGGVCVVSPFQSILDYELSLGIPPGWVNYCISKTAPDGFWHRLEKGIIPMDAAFYAGFNRDLRDPNRWETFYRQAQQASDIPADQVVVPPVPNVDGKWLFLDMMAAARSPDPFMFPALRKLRENGKYVVAALSNTVIFPPGHEYSQTDFFLDDPVRRLFDVFISSAHIGLRKPDPEIYQLALNKVDEFARSNATTDRGKALGFPAAEGVSAGEIVFLDDIGQNLKAARHAGFRTIKVSLGKAYEAVAELEKVTGLSLAGDHPKTPIKPKL
ncbi:epoxide hydrolase [Lasiosphaeria miniovina]|uniref:Epoxide hydrolase n=1 Tax=Lasiosphaeria miniovina TaxID=1954250 RepID=A0AA40B3Q8_9PEZI|nr:epoxide hydrolase [Lasiosphaeria miniovina]KAK0726968.1 epoxide hydrolase [Lasiosphaeria miniovina]